MKALAPLILAGLGSLLLVLGLLWGVLFPAERTWTEEKSQQMTALQNEAHKLLFLAERAKTRPQPGGPTPSEAQAKFEAAKAELDALKAEFEGVRDSPQSTGSTLRWVGTGMVLLGGFALMLGREG